MAENRLSEILVGGAVLAVAAGFLLYAAEIGGIGRSTGSSYEVSALFRSAEGIGIGTDVRLAGDRVAPDAAVGERGLRRIRLEVDVGPVVIAGQVDHGRVPSA